MKITRLEFNDFRAFACPESFDLMDGKNVILYGANGAGKSSVFRALKEIFQYASPEPFSNFKNIFTDPSRVDGYVKLHFSVPAVPGGINSPAEWLYPGPRAAGDQRIVQGATRVGAIDYRSLLDTNYVFRNGEINLFNVLVNEVLPNWLILIKDRGLVRLGTLRDEMLACRIPTSTEQYREHLAKGGGPRHRTKVHTQGRIDKANASAAVFFEALKDNLPRLVLLANRLLRRLGIKGLAFTLLPSHITYSSKSRDFSPQQIGIRVRFNGEDIPKPQMFLNEARLSAMALALYFAALFKAVPNDPTWPRVLVLDDVLIGLDMDNRLPVLDILRNEFRDWQVILLTHDRTWFELAQLATNDDGRWVSFEMYPRSRRLHGKVIADVPLKEVVGNNPSEHFLERANYFFGINDYRTAAFYARAAFEAKLKGYCHDKKVQVAYDLTGHELTTEHFMDGIERRLTWSGKMPKARFKFNRVKMFRKGVLNPMAHFHPVTISPGEVEQAITAVSDLEFPSDKADSAQLAHTLLRKAALNAEELLAAACWLRTAFEVDLRELLVRFNSTIGFRHDWNKLTLADLWDSCKAAVLARNMGLAGPLIAAIEAHRAVFLNDFIYSTISFLDKAALDAAWIALRDAAANPVKTRLATFP